MAIKTQSEGLEITWKYVFNGNLQVWEDYKALQDEAKRLNYQFFAYGKVVFETENMNAVGMVSEL